MEPKSACTCARARIGVSVCSHSACRAPFVRSAVVREFGKGIDQLAPQNKAWPQDGLLDLRNLGSVEQRVGAYGRCPWIRFSRKSRRRLASAGAIAGPVLIATVPYREALLLIAAVAAASAALPLLAWTTAGRGKEAPPRWPTASSTTART